MTNEPSTAGTEAEGRSLLNPPEVAAPEKVTWTTAEVAEIVAGFERALSEANAIIASQAEIVSLAEELVNGGGLKNYRGEVLAVVEKADKSDPHYRLCTVLEKRARLNTRTAT